jgi:hypothetical protein
MGYQYCVDVQGYMVDMYIQVGVKWLGNRIDQTLAALYVMSQELVQL